MEIFDDIEPKTDIKNIVCYFNSFKKVSCLTIVGNNMGNKECAKLSEGLAYLKELRILNLSFNSLTDNNISKFAFDPKNKIEVLNLKSNNITDTGIDSIKNELLKLKNLKEINLYDNQFGDQGFKTLISVVKTLKNLRVLTIPNCGVTQVGITFFAECFMKEGSDFMEKLECLNLVSNPFGDECEKNLIKIFKNLKSLKKYNLGQTQMSRFSKHKIFVALHKINNNWYFEPKGGWYQISPNDLREEYLFKNIIKNNEIPLIFDRININWAKKNAKKYQNKLNFDFSPCNFTDKDILALIDFIKYFPNIRSLNISFNPKITSKGYLNLSEGLKNLFNLSKIDLSSNNLSDEEIEEEFRVVQKIPYKFSYKFEDDSGRQAKLMIEDWEVGMLYLNCLKRYGDEKIATEKVRQKYFDEFTKRDLYFFLGTTLKFHNVSPNPFIIIGVFCPPLPDEFEQLSMF